MDKSYIEYGHEIFLIDVSLFKTLKDNVEKVGWIVCEEKKTCITYFSSILSE